MSPTEEEHSNAATNSRKRKLTYVVWNHFDKVQVNGKDKAECRYCKKKLGANSKNGTRHLHDHFKSCPRRNTRDIRQQVLGMGQKQRIRVAAALDPRFKLKIMEFAFPKLYSFQKSDGELVNLKELVYRLFQDYETCSYGSSRNRDGIIQVASDGEEGFFNDYFTFVEEDSHIGTTSELHHYLQEKTGKQNSDFDILSWWKTNSFKYPTLQKIAQDILAIPISTVASESAFSTSGGLVSPHCSRLHPKTLQALMCAQSWLLNKIKAIRRYNCLSLMNDDGVGVVNLLRCHKLGRNFSFH